MSKVIIYTNNNGNVSVCVPTGELPIEDVLIKDAPEHAIIIEDNELPEADNDFFNCWELVNDVVLVNIAKAKIQTKDRLRAEREPLLAAQDIAFQRALETGSDTSIIIAEKQRLRDITDFVNPCTTLDELRNLSC